MSPRPQKRTFDCSAISVAMGHEPTYPGLPAPSSRTDHGLIQTGKGANNVAPKMMPVPRSFEAFGGHE